MSISCKRLRELLIGLKTAKAKSFKITNLKTPDGSTRRGRGIGHTQGVACFGEYLVISNNQEPGVGYVALCKKKPNSDDYEYVSRVEDLPEDKPLRYGHPGGVQMFEHSGKKYVIVPFEWEGDKLNGKNIYDPNIHFKESEIRFYYIDEPNNFQFKYANLKIERKNKKAGSVGVVKHDDDSLTLAVAYNKNAVDFYKVSLSDGPEGKHRTLPCSDGGPSYVNALPLLTCEDKNKSQENIYIAGRTDEESLRVSKVDFLSGGKVEINQDSKLDIDLRSKMGKECILFAHSFRWAGNCFLSEKEDRLSIIALKRSISKDNATEAKMISFPESE